MLLKRSFSLDCFFKFFFLRYKYIDSIYLTKELVSYVVAQEKKFIILNFDKIYFQLFLIINLLKVLLTQRQSLVLLFCDDIELQPLVKQFSSLSSIFSYKTKYKPGMLSYMGGTQTYSGVFIISKSGTSNVLHEAKQLNLPVISFIDDLSKAISSDYFIILSEYNFRVISFYLYIIRLGLLS